MKSGAREGASRVDGDKQVIGGISRHRHYVRRDGGQGPVQGYVRRIAMPRSIAKGTAALSVSVARHARWRVLFVYCVTRDIDRLLSQAVEHACGRFILRPTRLEVQK